MNHDRKPPSKVSPKVSRSASAPHGIGRARGAALFWLPWPRRFDGFGYPGPDISKWDTGKVTNMMQMFRFATSFNPDLSKWNTGAVTNMAGMFEGATSFNADLSKWETGKVYAMVGMFNGATNFNADLSKWDTGKVTDMYAMFEGATSFTEKKFCPSAPEGVDLTCPA